MFKLTDPKGVDAATNPHAKQGADLRVVAFMYAMRKPVELEEVMDEIHLSDEITVTIMKRLINGGYVEEI